MKHDNFEPVETTDFSPFKDGVEWLSQYIIGSFYFSQGNSGLQDYFDRYMRVKHEDEFMSVPVDSSKESEIFTLTLTGIQQFFATGKHRAQVSHQSVDREIELRIVRLEKLKSAISAHIDHEETLKKVFSLFMGVEGVYLNTPNDFISTVHPISEKASRSKRTHPRFGRSIFLEHLIDDRDAHHPVFDNGSRLV